MYAHRTIQHLNGLHVQLELPSEFADCQEAEIIVLPIIATQTSPESWAARVLAVAGSLSDDFPDDIDSSDLGQDVSRAEFE